MSERDQLRHENAERIATVMANGHTYRNRVADGQIERGEREVLRQRIYNTLVDPGTEVIRIPEKDGTFTYKFYNKEKNFIVIIDQKAKDWGTAYSPDSGRGQYLMREPGVQIQQNGQVGYLDRLKLGFFRNQDRFHQVETRLAEKPIDRAPAPQADGSPGLRPAVRNGAAGIVLALGAGAASAGRGESGIQILDTMIDTGIPGWFAARRGRMCRAFGEIAGTVVSGVASAAAAFTSATAAATVTVASGPASPVVGPIAAVAATGAVATVAVTTDRITTNAVESACTAMTRPNPSGGRQPR